MLAKSQIGVILLLHPRSPLLMLLLMLLLRAVDIAAGAAKPPVSCGLPLKAVCRADLQAWGEGQGTHSCRRGDQSCHQCMWPADAFADQAVSCKPPYLVCCADTADDQGLCGRGRLGLGQLRL